MKKLSRLAGSVLVVCAVLALGACGGGAAGEDGPIKVGLVVSATGAAGSLGEPQQNTVQLFQDEFNQVGDREIEWIIRDDASNPTEAVTTVNSLIQDEDVAAVICCSVSPNSMSILPTIEQQQTPNISLAAAASIVEPVEEREWVFKTTHNDALVTDVLAEYMGEEGLNDIAFLGFNDDFGQSGAEAFKESVSESGIGIAGMESFNREDTDISAQLTSLRNQDPDAYVIWGIPPGAVTAHQDLVRLGIEAPVFQSHGSYVQSFLELGGEDVEDTLIAAEKISVADELPDDDPQKETIIEFRDAYEAEYGEGSANVFGAMTYDAMRITSEAAQRAIEGDVDPADVAAFREALRDEIENTSDLPGTMGVFNYSPEDHGGLGLEGLVMQRVEDNQFTLIEEQ